MSSESSGYSGAAVAGSMFASVILMIVGSFQFFAGLAALVNDETFVIGPSTSSSSTPPPGAGSTCSWA